MRSYEIAEVKLGKNKDAPRVWLEGRRLERAGFTPGVKYDTEVQGGSLVLKIIEAGRRIVSSKKRRDANDVPVIDINAKESLAVFAGLERLRVVIREKEIHLLPLATQIKAHERLDRITTKLKRGQPLSVGSLCHGGGVLALALHEGLKSAGVTTKLVFANDIDAGVLEQASHANPVWTAETATVAAPMQEVMADDWLKKNLGQVEILEAGIPCVGASLAGRAKKGLNMAEADPNAGHLVVAFLGIVEALQPAIVIVENVPPYQNTASAHLIRYTLRDLGYDVQETILEGLVFGSLEDRKRLAFVAMTKGLAFDLANVKAPLVAKQTLADVLEDIPLDAPCWSTMDYLRDKEVRDKAAGKGFRMQILGPEDHRVGTIGREYQKNRSTEPKVRHPLEGDRLLRLLTPTEHARIKGVPAGLIDGMPATRAHQLLGNGVCFAPFHALGEAIGKALRQSVQSPALALAS